MYVFYESEFLKMNSSQFEQTVLKYTFMHHINTKLTLLEVYTITSFSELEQKPQRPFPASIVKTIFSQTHINLPLLILYFPRL